MFPFTSVLRTQFKKISYERRAYESVDEKRVYLRLCPEKRRKNEFGPYRVNIQNTTIFEPVILTGFYTTAFFVQIKSNSNSN